MTTARVAIALLSACAISATRDGAASAPNTPETFMVPSSALRLTATAPGTAIAAELERAGRTGGVKIYPSTGRTPAEAHSIVYVAPELWEADVFGFLDRRVAH